MFAITRSAIDVQTASRKLTHPRAGACVSFEGWVRNHHEGRAVSHLEYEAYENLCLKEADSIRREAVEKFDIMDLHCVHRIGRCDIGDLAVWVGVTAEHRDAAFHACEYYMNQLKVRVPIWKKETYLTGEAEWVRCETCAQHEHVAHAGHHHD